MEKKIKLLSKEEQSIREANERWLKPRKEDNKIQHPWKSMCIAKKKEKLVRDI